MAEWIKARGDLADDPVIIQQARALGIDRDSAVGKWIRVWGWAREHTEDGFVEQCDLQTVDAVAQCEGFCDAAPRWVEVRDGGVFFPKWDKHNSNGAKERAVSAQRKALSRSRPVSVPIVSRCDRDKSGTRREEKREEERKTEIKTSSSAGADGHVAGASVRVLLVWEAWSVPERRVGKRDALKAIERAGKAVAAERFGGDVGAACDWLVERVSLYSSSRIVRTTPTKYLPHPATWFNKGRYDDEPAAWDRDYTAGTEGEPRAGQSTLDALIESSVKEASNGHGVKAGGGTGAVRGASLPSLESHPRTRGALG